MRGGNNRPGRERATEFDAKTVDEAIRAASHRFRVPPDELDIEVLDEGRVGFLGLGASKARIRARLKTQGRRGGGPDERRGGRGGPGAGGSGGGGRDRDRDRRPQSGGRSVDRGMSQGGGEPPSGPGAGRDSESDRGRDRSEVHSSDARGEDDSNRGRRRRGGRGRPRDGGGADSMDRNDRAPRDDRSHAPQIESSRDARPQRTHSRREGTPTVYDAALETEIAAFVKGLLERMGFPSTVSSKFEDGAYCLTVDAGDEDGILIGRKGETLDALQHVAYKMSGRGREDASTVRIDVSGYRERREEELAEEALQMAREVAASKKSRETEPLRAAERRIVHRAISDMEGVTTRAIGVGLVKRIVIELEGSEPAEDEREVRRSPEPGARRSPEPGARRSPEPEARRSPEPEARRSPEPDGEGVLDFVSGPEPTRPVVTGVEQSAEWGRKPRAARPGRRR